MKKVYFKFLIFAFFIGFATISGLFYLNYVKREQIKKERLRRIEGKEIIAILKENYPFGTDTIPLLKEIEKEYGVYIKINSKNGFNYTTDPDFFKTKIKKSLIPIKKEFSNRHLFPHKTKKPIFRDKMPARIIYYLDKRHKILKGLKAITPDFSVFVVKKQSHALFRFFIVLISVLSLFTAVIFFLIRKWYVNPLIELENSIKSIESNLNSPEFYRESDGMLQPIYNALNNLKKRVALEINAKEEMLRDISHDLKTPLTRIKLAVEFIEEKKVKEKIKEDVEEIENLISKILDVNSVKKNDCLSNLEVFLTEFKNKFYDLKITVLCEKNLEIPVCEGDLRRIFYNLADNSLKFANISKGVFVEAFKKDGKLRINYRDCETRGEKPDLDRIFNYFYKQDKARNQTLNRGFGLGLPIVKKITEQYGGEVEAAYSECNGLEFRFTFPLPSKNRKISES